MQRLYEIRGAVQQYAWGKVGSTSEVAKLSQRYTKINEDATYAELWMGDHPSGPSIVIHQTGENERLDQHIRKNVNETLGSTITRRFNSSLPFLFKVLSINKSLSVQAHPDQELAAKLHQARPDQYKDPNHKPEMALALTPMQLLCGFRPEAEILEHVKKFPHLRAVIGESASKNYETILENAQSSQNEKKEALKTLFKAVMTAKGELVEEQLKSLLNEIQQKKEHSLLEEIVLRVYSEFPGDVGVFSLFLLNILELEPGSAIFLGPNEPHAYLRGDCVECMATSDNVVRAGLTPKYKDVDTLINMLTYNTMVPLLINANVTKKDQVTIKDYLPPVSEFMVRFIGVPSSTTTTLDPTAGPSVFIVYEGTGTAISSSSGGITIPLSKGTILFVYPNERVTLIAAKQEKEEEESLRLYQATTNLKAEEI